jgi:acyl-coenzyme A synthetase/AMP-(fatty) acid ligase
VGLGVPGRAADEVGLLMALLDVGAAARYELELVSIRAADAVPLLEGGMSTGPSVEGAIALYTSGTTGVPKPIRRILAGEIERRRGRGSPDDVWLLTYAPFRWAGISVLLHALAVDCTIVVPSGTEPAALCSAILEQGVTHVSMTPSLFRKFQLAGMTDRLSASAVKQLTFGGEAADDVLLAAARKALPSARISHVYATTELGDVIAVSDGRAGLPITRIDADPRFEFTPDGELIVAGVRTGDIWERRDDRYVFVGRRQELINVGGLTVSPAEVEKIALQVEGVIWARAFAVPSPIVGEVVGLEYVGACSAAILRQALCASLPKPAWPVVVDKVAEITVSEALKTVRRYQ